MEIKKLTAEDLSAVYNVYMKKDFPPSELKPLAIFLETMEQNIAGGFGYYDGDKLKAYAFFAWTEGGRLVLLDYLAVKREERGRGIGGDFLRRLAREMPFEGMLIEIEDPMLAKNADQLKERRRRADFYLACCAEHTGLRTKLLDVNYEVLYLGMERTDLREVCGSELRKIYMRMVGPELYAKYCTIPDAR
ncbi:MAG: hypothetical protein VB112_04595 [Oscillospiraceae bacterium]|nr:hypothetical protein [Oscillospiraceae bacterium]